LKKIEPFRLYYGYIVDSSNDIIDEVTAVEMPAGKSYTGQKQAEIFCHGGQFIMKQILSEIVKHKCRLAEPGEFTRRAFLAGRIDLTKAEAVADMIGSKTEYAYSSARNNLLGRFSECIDGIRERCINLLAEIEASVDYPEEDIDPDDCRGLFKSLKHIIDEIRELSESYSAGKIIKEGYKVAIAGRTNAGKSSLFNILLNQNRAIVTPTPGTTRDWLEEWIDLGGFSVSITDTAGMRSSSGVVEKEGQKSSLYIMRDADLVIWIVDVSRKSWRKELENDFEEYKDFDNIKVIFNKIDKLAESRLKNIKGKIDQIDAFCISCKTGSGIKSLKNSLISRINSRMPDLTDKLIITSERHKQKLDSFLKHLQKVIRGLKKGLSPELIAFDFRQGINEIDEITGKVYNEEILDRIFSRFCIGK